MTAGRISRSAAPSAGGSAAGRISCILLAGLLILAGAYRGAAAGDGVVADIDGKHVYASEVNAAIERLPDALRARLAQPDERRKFVENFITEKLLLAEARRRKIDRSTEFNRLAEQLKNDILIALLRDRILMETKLDEKELRDFYEIVKKNFAVPEKRRARHILVSDEKKARAILKRILAGAGGVDQAGARFEAEARKHSEDRSTAAEGGDIGWNDREDLVPEFAKSVFSMKAGELLNHPVKTRFGWHVISLESIQPEAFLPFEEVRTQVKERLLLERGAKTIPELAKHLKEKSKIKIHDAGLKLLHIPSAND